LWISLHRLEKCKNNISNEVTKSVLESLKTAFVSRPKSGATETAIIGSIMKKLQAVLNFQTFDFRTNLTSYIINSHPKSDFRTPSSDFRKQVEDKYFELLRSEALKLSPEMYFVSIICQKDLTLWPRGLRSWPSATRLL
jgi:hypothetical protein